MSDGEELFGSLIRFGQHLRTHGFKLGPGRILSFCRAAARLNPTDPADLYWAGRLTMVDDHRRFADYDRAFSEWFSRSEQEQTAQQGEYVFGGWDDGRRSDGDPDRGDHPGGLGCRSLR